MIAQLRVSWLTPGGEAETEQRASPRQKVSMPAKVAVGGAAIDCTVGDISASGVQLLAPSVVRLILSQGLLVHAQRIWARFPLSGLRLTSVEEIRRSAHPQAEPLRQAWESWRASQSIKGDLP